MKSGGFGRGGRGALIHWGVFQFGRREKTGVSPCTGIPGFSRAFQIHHFWKILFFLVKKWFHRKNVLNTKDVFFYALQLLFEIFFEILIIFEINGKTMILWGFHGFRH